VSADGFAAPVEGMRRPQGGIRGRGFRCPRCGQMHTHRVWQCFASGHEADFWWCDTCRRSFQLEEAAR
jgi:transcription elongation factor Elf1